MCRFGHDDAAQQKQSLHPEPSPRRAGFLHYPFDDPPTSFERRQAEPARRPARGLFQVASQRSVARGSAWATKKLGLVSLTSKHVSLLGKFPIDERGKNAQEKRVSGPSSGGNPKLIPRRKLSGIIPSSPRRRQGARHASSQPFRLRSVPCVDLWFCLGVKKDRVL